MQIKFPNAPSQAVAPVAPVSSMPTGTILSHVTKNTLEGYLLCDGSLVEVSSFSNLHTVIGNRYDKNTVISLPTYVHSAIGNGQPWKYQQNFNNSIGLKNFREIPIYRSTTLPFRADETSATFQIGNKLYILSNIVQERINDPATGGSENVYRRNTLFSFTVDANDNLTNFMRELTVVPFNCQGGIPIVTKNKVYIYNVTNLDMVDGVGSPLPNNVFVFQADITIDGNIADFIATPQHQLGLPNFLDHHSVIMTKSRLYFIRQQRHASFNDGTLVATIDVNGTIGLFTPLPDFLPFVNNVNIPTNTQDWVTTPFTNIAYAFNNDIYIFVLSDRRVGDQSTLDILYFSIFKSTIDANGIASNAVDTGRIFPFMPEHNGLNHIVTASAIYLFYTNFAMTSSALAGGDPNPDTPHRVYKITLGTEKEPEFLEEVKISTLYLDLKPLAITRNKLYLIKYNTEAIIRDLSYGTWETLNENFETRVYTLDFISGNGVNNYNLFHNGSINKFDGTSPTGNILLHLNNPNHTTTFRLPNREDLEYTETKLNYYIKT